MENTETGPAIPVAFSGKTLEFFGIWIVNLLLSIATLGIYSAWAKVRTRKYLLRNTSIAGRSFDYHARGLQILFGRAIIVAAIIAWTILAPIFPYNFLLIAVFVFAVPWLANRGLRFNAAMTSWSNVRFSFKGSYWHAFRVYILYPLLSSLTLFLAYPFAHRARNRYAIGGHSFGGRRFSFDGAIRPFYRALFMAALWLIAAAAATFIVGTLALSDAFRPDLALSERTLNYDTLAALFLVYAGIIIALLPLATIYNAFVRNAVFAGTILEDGHRFASAISPFRLVAISITNAVAITISIGMLAPWARIRVARYLAAHSWVIPADSLDAFIGDVEERQSAIGDAYTDIEGFDAGAAI